MMLTFAEEAPRDIIPEIIELIPLHWSEVTRNREVLPQVRWDEALRYADNGMLFALAARNEEKELVGYVIFVVYKPWHYEQLTFAHDDAFFLKKEYRGNGEGTKMIMAAEQLMKSKGATHCIFHQKTIVNNGKVFEKLGYHQEEILWRKAV